MDIGPRTPGEELIESQLGALPAGARVLEIGTRRWLNERVTHHGHWIPEGVAHIKLDAMDGLDVDVVADAHQMSNVFPVQFEAVICSSTFEHLLQPWVVAEEIARVTKPGGVIWIETVQTFPIHGYPDDYFRFSANGLRSLFPSTDWVDRETRHTYPCKIIPPADINRWDPNAPAYLCVELTATRRAA